MVYSTLLYGSMVVVAWIICNVIIGARGLEPKEYPQGLIAIGAVFWPILVLYLALHLVSVSMVMIGDGIVAGAHGLQSFGQSFRKDV